MLNLASIKISDAPPPAGGAGAFLDYRGNSTLGGPRIFTPELAASLQEKLREKFPNTTVTVGFGSDTCEADIPAGIDPAKFHALVEAYAKAQYLSVTRRAGISDDFAMQTYASNEVEAKQRAAFLLLCDLKQGKALAEIEAFLSTADPFMDEPPELPQDRLPNDVGGVSGQRLKSFIERVERLTAEQKDLGDDKKQIFAEAKATGFCTKTMRKIIRLRGMDAEKRREEEQLEELYMAAIGEQTEMDL